MKDDDTSPNDNDLKAALGAHLDEALPTADERREDLASLPRRARRFRGGPLSHVGAALAGAVVAGGAFLAPSLAARVQRAGDDAGGAGVTVDETGKGAPLAVRGDARVFARSVAAAAGRFRGLADVFAERRVRDDSEQEPVLAVFDDVVASVPGLEIRADACLAGRRIDVVADAVPANVLLDVISERLDLEVKTSESAVEFHCRGVTPGATTVVDTRHRWPPPDPRLSHTVSLDADDTTLDEALDMIAHMEKLTVRYGARAHPKLKLHLDDVTLGTALQALSESSGIPVHLDGAAVVASGPELPEVKAMLDNAQAKPR